LYKINLQIHDSIESYTPYSVGLQMKKVYISDYRSDNSINHKRDIPLFYDLFYCDVHNIRRIWSLM
jgi:hypothetical protein